MKSLLFVAVAAFCVSSAYSRVVCYWNPDSVLRPGAGRCTEDDIEPALSMCSHLILLYAGIDPTQYTVQNLHSGLDYNFYWQIKTRLKTKFPTLKVYLNVGMGDPYESTHKYMHAIENSVNRRQFIDSVVLLLKRYEFDGIDLAWQFPPAGRRISVGSRLVRGSKRNLYVFVVDNHTSKHGFTALVRDLNVQLQARNKTLTLTILPHVNVSAYYDVSTLDLYVDAVHLMAFDQQTPQRNPKTADYPAPIYKGAGRHVQKNVQFIVSKWLAEGMPASKLILGIPTYARTWKLGSNSKISTTPVLNCKGPGKEGPMTNFPGVLSYPEVCLLNSTNGLSEHAVASGRYGRYAYRPYDPKTQKAGIWVGYEDPQTALHKADYIRSNSLGGIAIVDLSSDDFRGLCSGERFPILKMVYWYF